MRHTAAADESTLATSTPGAAAPVRPRFVPSKLERFRLSFGINANRLAIEAGYSRTHMLNARMGRLPKYTARFRRDVLGAVQRVLKEMARGGNRPATAALKRGVKESDLF